MNSFLKQIFTPPHVQLVDNKRIAWIHLAKGIGIVLVVVIHTVWANGDTPTFMMQFIMPLFYLLSGVFFKDYGSFSTYGRKKINSLLIPFVFFYILEITYVWLLPILAGKPFTYPDYMQLFTQRFFQNRAIYFLLSLFEITIIYYWIHKWSPNLYVKITLVTMCAACGVMLDHRGVFAPLYLDTALTALPFFFTGHLLRNSFIFRPATHAHMHALVAAFLMIILMVAPNYIGDSKIIFADNQIVGNAFVAYISAFLGVVSLLLISKAIAWLPLFSYLGRYSMVVLCVHQIFIYALCLHQLGIYENVHLICVVTLILSWLSIPICKRYIPWFVAQKDIIHLNEVTKHQCA